MKSNNLPELDIVKASNDFDFLKKIAVENNFFKYLNKYALPTLNLSKLKNFVISCIEEKEFKTNLTSRPYHIIVDPTNACNLGCPLCPTGAGQSQRIKGILKCRVGISFCIKYDLIKKYKFINDQYEDFEYLKNIDNNNHKIVISRFVNYFVKDTYANCKKYIKIFPRIRINY